MLPTSAGKTQARDTLILNNIGLVDQLSLKYKLLDLNIESNL